MCAQKAYKISESALPLALSPNISAGGELSPASCGVESGQEMGSGDDVLLLANRVSAFGRSHHVFQIVTASDNGMRPTPTYE